MKIKSKTKECQLFVKVKVASGEILDDKELSRFSRLFLRGFLKPKIDGKNSIEYTGPIGMSLYERLKSPLTKREFFFILEQIVVAVQKIHANNLAIRNLLMDPQYVYVNAVTKEVQFIYIPLTIGMENLNLVEFIETIAYSTIPADEKDTDFVSRFIYFFRSLKPFNVNKVEEFIVREDRSIVNTIKKQNAGQSGFMTNKPQHYYDHYEKKEKDEEATGLLPADDDPTGLLVEDDDPTGLLHEVGHEVIGFINNQAERKEPEYMAPYDEEATGLLFEVGDTEATGLLSDNETNGLLVDNRVSVHFPTIYRTLTEETISVNKPVFRLGKERSYVDYFVTNNIAVSRSHADIITRGNRYYVKDLNSKNHTYINNRELPVHAEVEIQDGDTLKLGNEEFIFHI